MADEEWRKPWKDLTDGQNPRDLFDRPASKHEWHKSGVRNDPPRRGPGVDHICMSSMVADPVGSVTLLPRAVEPAVTDSYEGYNHI